MVCTYAAEMASTNVKVNLIDPGPMRTAMRAQAMPGEDPSTLPDPSSVTDQVVEMLSADFERNGALYDLRRGEYLTPA